MTSTAASNAPVASRPRPKVLVARIGAIGDICLLMPVVHALTRHFDVDWLIRDAHIPVVRAFPHVACGLIGVSPAADEQRPFPAELVTALRGGNYHALIDFSHWQAVAWLARELREIPVRAITHDPAQDALLGVKTGPPEAATVFNRVVPVASDAHQLSKWLTLVRAACGVDLQLDWPLPARRAWPGDGALRIFVHAHASKPEKQWAAKHFATVLRRVARRRPLHCVLNGVRRRITGEVRLRLLLSRASSEVVALDATYARLRQALLSADLAFGCDSGPMQFAALLGVPTLVLYGRYPAAQFGPLWRSRAVSPALPGADVDAVTAHQATSAMHTWLDELRSARAGEDVGAIRLIVRRD